MRKNLIENVKMPMDAKVDNSQAFFSLKKRGCLKSEHQFPSFREK